MSPMIKGADGQDKYSMNPSFGKAIEEARGEEEKESSPKAKGGAKSVRIEKLDDGTYTSEVSYPQAKSEVGESSAPSYTEPTRGSHKSLDEAKSCLDAMA